MARIARTNLSQILLVEGKNDYHVLLSLCKHYDLPETFKIIDKEGVENVLETLEAEIAGSSNERIGVIVDADTDLKARWTEISSILARCGYLPPEAPDKNGTIIPHDRKPTIGVWLMPDNRLPGELEDFIAFLVPDKHSDSLWRHATQSLSLLPASPTRFPDQDRSKAHIHTWLAWQREPGKPLGQAITARYLDANAPDAQCLMQWLKTLFVQAPETLST